MTIRTQLLEHFTTTLAGTSLGVSSELPWVSGGVALHDKNMKRVYLDREQQNVDTMLGIINGIDICQRETLITAYFTVDAKNQPQDINSITEALVNAKDIIVGHHINECDITTVMNEDRITYEVEYRFVGIN